MSARHATVADLPSEFDSVDSRDLSTWQRISQARISLAVWGAKSHIAHALLWSHMLKRANLGSGSTASGPVSSESAGDVSVSYAVANVDSSDYATTVYGREFDSMRKAIFVGPVVAGSRPNVTMR